MKRKDRKTILELQDKYEKLKSQLNIIDDQLLKLNTKPIASAIQDLKELIPNTKTLQTDEDKILHKVLKDLKDSYALKLQRRNILVTDKSHIDNELERINIKLKELSSKWNLFDKFENRFKTITNSHIHSAISNKENKNTLQNKHHKLNAQLNKIENQLLNINIEDIRPINNAISDLEGLHLKNCSNRKKLLYKLLNDLKCYNNSILNQSKSLNEKKQLIENELLEINTKLEDNKTEELSNKSSSLKKQLAAITASSIIGANSITPSFLKEKREKTNIEYTNPNFFERLKMRFVKKELPSILHTNSVNLDEKKQLIENELPEINTKLEDNKTEELSNKSSSLKKQLAAITASSIIGANSITPSFLKEKREKTNLSYSKPNFFERLKMKFVKRKLPSILNTNSVNLDEKINTTSDSSEQLAYIPNSNGKLTREEYEMLLGSPSSYESKPSLFQRFKTSVGKVFNTPKKKIAAIALAAGLGIGGTSAIISNSSKEDLTPASTPNQEQTLENTTDSTFNMEESTLSETETQIDNNSDIKENKTDIKPTQKETSLGIGSEITLKNSLKYHASSEGTGPSAYTTPNTTYKINYIVALDDNNHYIKDSLNLSSIEEIKNKYPDSSIVVHLEGYGWILLESNLQNTEKNSRQAFTESLKEKNIDTTNLSTPKPATDKISNELSR